VKGVILAAGDGTRLLPYTYRCPKVLLKVGGQSIIDFTLSAFAEMGVTDVAVVVGYLADMVKDWVGEGSRLGLRIQYFFNPDYECGNGVSLYAARSFAGDERFVLSMADHMVSPSFLRQFLEAKELTDALAVDFAPSTRQVEEATKVLVNREGLVTQIGKDIPRWNGIDAGVFLLGPVIFDTIAELLMKDEAQCELSQAVAQLIARGYPLQARDISGCFWQDVDSPEDLELVTDRLTGKEAWKGHTRV
jgi:choline kinase